MRWTADQAVKPNLSLAAPTSHFYESIITHIKLNKPNFANHNFKLKQNSAINNII